MILETTEMHHVPCTVCDGKGFLKAEIEGEALYSTVYEECHNCIDGISFSAEFEIMWPEMMELAGNGWKISSWQRNNELGDKIYELYAGN